jgi:histidine triad (HIT) family protein
LDCIFCEIVAGRISTDLIASNDHAVAFKDIRPQAPVHLLIVPKQHTQNIAELTDSEVLMGLFELIRETAAKHTSGSFRLQFNTGADSGQTVFHTHAHLLAKA